MTRNSNVLQALGDATEDETIFVMICPVGKGWASAPAEVERHRECIGACGWGLRAALFGSEDDLAAAARWRSERLLWLGAQPQSGSLLSTQPP